MAGGDGHPQHRQCGLGGDHTRQVSGATGSGDDGAQAALAGSGGILEQQIRGAMGRDHLRLVGHAVLLEDAGGSLQHGPVGVGAHYQADQGRGVHFL